MVQKATLPEAVYACANTSCAAEVSYPPDMLYWWAGSAGFLLLGSTAIEDEDLRRLARPESGRRIGQEGSNWLLRTRGCM